MCVPPSYCPYHHGLGGYKRQAGVFSGSAKQKVETNEGTTDVEESLVDVCPAVVADGERSSRLIGGAGPHVLVLIHPIAWKENSAKFGFIGFSEVQMPQGGVGALDRPDLLDRSLALLSRWA
jgi:hypothetical protein